MKNIIQLVEESIKAEQFNVAYHENKLNIASNNLQLLEKQLIELKKIADKEDETVQ